MTQFDRIMIDPAVMNGQPCIRGTRLTVRRVVLVVAQYRNPEEIRKNYPQLKDEDIDQALKYAAANLADEIIQLETAK